MREQLPIPAASVGNRAPAVLSQAGLRAPASASGASNGQRREQRRSSSASDDEVGGTTRAQDRAPLSWTNERADMLFVCE
jgi:hypothetical protein